MVALLDKRNVKHPTRSAYRMDKTVVSKRRI